MATAALFTIAKMWKQPKCPSTDEWINKMWGRCVYVCVCVCVCVCVYFLPIEYYSAVKKNEIMPFAATWMDIEIIILTEISQTEKDRYTYINITYMWNRKKGYKWTYLQNRNRLKDIENKLMVTKGDSSGGGVVVAEINYEFGINMYTLQYTK